MPSLAAGPLCCSCCRARRAMIAFQGSLPFLVASMRDESISAEELSDLGGGVGFRKIRPAYTPVVATGTTRSHSCRYTTADRPPPPLLAAPPHRPLPRAPPHVTDAAPACAQLPRDSYHYFTPTKTRTVRRPSCCDWPSTTDYPPRRWKMPLPPPRPLPTVPHSNVPSAPNASKGRGSLQGTRAAT
jgi:hypothetical protein